MQAFFCDVVMCLHAIIPYVFLVLLAFSKENIPTQYSPLKVKDFLPPTYQLDKLLWMHIVSNG